MNKHIIGLNAGIIWRLLSNQEKWTYNDLKTASGLTDRELNTAIGWLAREGKIEFEQEYKSGKEMFYLMLNIYI